MIKNSEYKNFIHTLKYQIQSAQIKAAVAVNRELLQLYWLIGSQIVEKQKISQWGDGLVKQVSHDLQAEFPDMKGFSTRNIHMMKQWYLYWYKEPSIVQQLVAQLEQAPIFQIPWGQNLLIISKANTTEEAFFYVQKTITSFPRSRVGMHTELTDGQKSLQNNQPGSTVLHWIPVFTRPDTVNILLESLKFLSNDGLKVYAYVILENHCHFVVQSKALDHDIARYKSYTAKQIIQYLSEHNIKQILQQLAFYKKAHKHDRAYQFWQEGVHPELIQNDEMMRQKIDYIHHNPVKRGYVDKAEHWRYSSARDYAGQTGLLEICRQW